MSDVDLAPWAEVRWEARPVSRPGWPRAVVATQVPAPGCRAGLAGRDGVDDATESLLSAAAPTCR